MTRILIQRTGALGDILETTAIVRRLRHENPDALIHFDTAYPQVFAPSLYIDVHELGSSNRLQVYDRVIDLNGAFEKGLRKLHPIDAYSEVAFGDRATPHDLHFPWTPASTQLRSYIGSAPVVLHAARSWPIRTLPLEWWQSLVNLLTTQGIMVVLTGTAQDHDGLTNVLDLRGRLNLQEQAGLIDAASCFVCSESGPMILAQVTRTPIIPLLTMVPPEHVAHLRNGQNNWRWHPVRASVPCVGCAQEQPSEAIYFDCRLGTRACITAFNAREIADLIARVSISRSF